MNPPPFFASLVVLLSVSAFAADTPSPVAPTPNVASAKPTEASAMAPAEKDGLSVIVEPVKNSFAVNEPLILKVTYRNTSKAALRLATQVTEHPSGAGAEHTVDRSGAFWQLTLQEQATGKIYPGVYPPATARPELTSKASAAIQPGGTLVTTVELPATHFRVSGSAALAGPGPGYSSVGYIPMGAYKMTVNIQFPLKPLPDKDPTPLWRGDSIQANPVDITITGEKFSR